MAGLVPGPAVDDPMMVDETSELLDVFLDTLEESTLDSTTLDDDVPCSMIVLPTTPSYSNHNPTIIQP